MTHVFNGLPARATSRFACTIAVFVLSEILAVADPITIPIRITAGSVEITSLDLPPDLLERAGGALTGANGFRLRFDGFGSLPGGGLFNFSGNTLSLSGSVQARGADITYLNLGGTFGNFDSGGRGVVNFSSSEMFLLRPVAIGVVEFQAPFTASGLFELRPNPSLGDTRPQRLFQLVGSGHATASFFAGSEFEAGQEFRFRNEVFDFTDSPSPTPEPGTAMLLGGALVAMYGWKRWRDTYRSRAYWS
jgi:PEP-CTERM motif